MKILILLSFYVIQLISAKPPDNDTTPAIFICSILSPDNCMGVSLLDAEGPFPGQSLQLKSLNASIESNSTLLMNRVVWGQTNTTELFLTREGKNSTVRRLYLGDKWPFGGQHGRSKDTYLVKKRQIASTLEPLGEDQWGRVKINATEWCLTITKCVKNDANVCRKDTAVRVTNESQITRGSYVKWTQCLNNTHVSQWFFPLPPTPSPTSSPTVSPTTEAPTFPDETRQPTLEPTTETPTLVPTDNQSKEYEPQEYEHKNLTLSPTDAPTLEPTQSPTVLPTLTPTSLPTLSPTTFAPTSPPTIYNQFISESEFYPWKGKFL